MPDSFQTSPFPTWITKPNLISVGQAYTYEDVRRSWTPRVSPFKSLKIIGIDTYQLGRYTFHSNHAWAYLVPFPRFSEILAENYEFSHVLNPFVMLLQLGFRVQ